jgi:lysophospholipase L1-like esterase
MHSTHRLALTLRILALLLMAAMLLAACGKAREQALPAGSTVLALGDSLTEGYGVAREEAWPKLLADKSGWTVINGGVSGDTSAAALQRLPALLEQHKPALVLIALGGNDMLRHLPVPETTANLARAIALVRAQGAKPVLLATPNPSLLGAVFQHLSPPAFYRQVAEEQQVPLIEDALSDVISDPQLKVDQLHPNAAGHALLAEKIYKALQTLGYAH